MIRLRGTVTYEGGREQAFEAGTRALIAWEAYAHRHELEPYGDPPKHPNTMLAFVAYASLDVPEGFDVWLASVVDVSPAEGEALVPPTLPAPTVAQ